MVQAVAIGLLGGSFNPPHSGHRALVEHAMRRLRLNGVRVLVSPQNPLKEAASYLPLEERIEATRSLMRGLPSVRVEAEAETGPTFAIESIGRRVKRQPGRDFVYIMGADTFAGLDRWARWRELMELLPVAVISRPGYRLPALHSAAARAFAKARLPETTAPVLARMKAPAWTFIGGLEREEASTRIRSAAPLSSSGPIGAI